MENATLIAHCGAHNVTRSEVEGTDLPKATMTYAPVHHADVLTLAEETLARYGYTPAEEAHVMTRNGTRYFGLMRFAPGDAEVRSDDYELIVGLRNSYDKSFAVGYAWGSRVFVCDNMAFSGEQVLSRKHTRHIARDLPGLMGASIERLQIHWELMKKRFDHYKGSMLTAPQSEHVLVEAIRRNIIPASKVGMVLKEWDEPSHEEFREDGPTVWRMYNAFTENQKGQIVALPERTQKLQRLCDDVSELKLAA